MKALDGKMMSGVYDVFIEGKKAARKGDYQEHGGSICEGHEAVLIGGVTLLAARAGDRFPCTEMTLDGKPHVAGFIVAGAPTVIIGNKQAARVDDPTLCTADPAVLGPLPG